MVCGIYLSDLLALLVLSLGGAAGPHQFQLECSGLPMAGRGASAERVGPAATTGCGQLCHSTWELDAVLFFLP